MLASPEKIDLTICSVVVLLVMLICPAALRSAAQVDEAMLLRAGKVERSTEFALERIRKLRWLHPDSSATVESLRRILQQNLVPEMLFQAEGLERGMHKEAQAVAVLAQQRRRLMTAKNSPLWQEIQTDAWQPADSVLSRALSLCGLRAQLQSIHVRSRSLADSLHKRLQSGESIAELAPVYSVDPSGAGTAGIERNPRRIFLENDAMQRALMTLPVDSLSTPIESRDGFWLFRIRKRYAVGCADSTTLSADIIAELREREQLHRLERFNAQLVTRFALKIDSTDWRTYRAAWQKLPEQPILKPSALPKNLLSKPIVRWQGGHWTGQDFVAAYNTAAQENQIPILSAEDLLLFARRAIAPVLQLQEAERQKLDQHPLIASQIRFLREKQAGDRYLRLLRRSVTKIPESSLREMYARHRQDFDNRPYEQVRTVLMRRARSQARSQQRMQEAGRLQKKHRVEFNEDQLTALAAELMATHARPANARSGD